MNKKRIAVMGAAGYTGGELIRLLSLHEKVEIVKATSRSNCGKKVSDVHRNLQGFTDLCFTDEPVETIPEDTDLVFLALPHSIPMNVVPELMDRTRMIDLSGDYRLADVNVYHKYYREHASPHLIDRFVYGLTEFNRSDIKKAENVANPGCFPTGSLLALGPLARENMLSGNVVIDAKTGSSGSGATPGPGAHHPERSADLRAYKVLEHQHQPEIEQELRRYNQGDFDLTFVTHSVPLVRGIFITAYVFTDEKLPHDELCGIYQKYYGEEKFVRMVDQARCNVVKNTNFCDISLHSSGKKVVITAALDNLVKGASGTAVQNMNLMLNFPETEALMHPGAYP